MVVVLKPLVLSVVSDENTLAKLSFNFRKSGISNFCTEPSVGEHDTSLFGFFS